MVAGFLDGLVYMQNFTHTADYTKNFSPDSVFMGGPAYCGYQAWVDMRTLSSPVLNHADNILCSVTYSPPLLGFNNSACLACTAATLSYDTFFALSGIQNAKFAQFFVLQNSVDYALFFKPTEAPTLQTAIHAWSLFNGWGRLDEVTRWIPRLSYPECLRPLDHLIGRPGVAWPRCQLSALSDMLSPVYAHIADPLASIGQAWAPPVDRLACHLNGMTADQYHAYCRALVGHPIADFYSSVPSVVEPVQHIRWRGDVVPADSSSSQYRAQTFSQFRLKYGIVNGRPGAHSRFLAEFAAEDAEVAPSVLSRFVWPLVRAVAYDVVCNYVNLMLIKLLRMSLSGFSIIYWFPWLNFYSECLILQLIMIISLYLFITSSNLYYLTVYMLLNIFLMGVFLAFYNLEVLTGFLLVVELTAFFIIVLFLLTLNFEGSLVNRSKSFASFSFVLLFAYLFFLFIFTRHHTPTFLNAIEHWDDYYEALNNDIMNDIFGLYLSYYSFNSPLFFLFGCLIFLATLVCISLLRAIRVYSQQNIVSMEYIFKFFKDLVGFDFLRKQNMTQQNKRRAVTRLVKFKKPEPKPVDKKVKDAPVEPTGKSAL